MNNENKVITMLSSINREVNNQEEWKEPLGLNKEGWKLILDHIMKIEVANNNLEVEYIEKNNLINKLKDWLKNTVDECKFYGLYEKSDTLNRVLEKIIELEGGNE